MGLRFCASLAGGQELASDPAFEVASVKLLDERRPARPESKPGESSSPSRPSAT
jgi:hypothetical protein